MFSFFRTFIIPRNRGTQGHCKRLPFGGLCSFLAMYPINHSVFIFPAKTEKKASSLESFFSPFACSTEARAQYFLLGKKTNLLTYLISLMLYVHYTCSHCYVLCNSNLEMTETRAFLPKAPFDAILVGASKLSSCLMRAGKLGQPLPHVHVLRHSIDHLGWLPKAVFLPLFQCTLWQNTSASGLAALDLL